VLLSIVLAGPSRAQTTAATTTTTTTAATTPPTIRLEPVTEEGKTQIRATVTLDGKPLKDLTVAFFVKRTFGNLGIGQDTTIEDGTAEVAFPTGLSGDSTGQLQVLARVTAPQQYANATAQSPIAGGTIVQPALEPFPRALWAPRAPVLMLAVIVAIIAVVWCCYVYVVFQIVAISRRRSHA
jgi:hypothetical protein